MIITDWSVNCWMIPEATPKEILKIMAASGLTILQVKSHLQVLLFISQLWMFLVY